VAQEGELFEFLGYVLQKVGYDGTLFRNPKTVYTKIRTLVPNLVILELGGFIPNVEEAYARISQLARVSFCADSRDRSGARFGRVWNVQEADAFLARPLHPRPVLGCIKTPLQGEPINQRGEELAAGDLVLDPISYRALRSCRLLPVSVREFRLLYLLASHPNRVWSRGT
jgi:DNA-binding response OmpR family regulator